MKGERGEDGSYGAGVFGHWSTDADGKPVYVYAMDHARDPRAAYTTSLGESRDHWHQVGTGEFVATVHNEGYCQLYDWSYGGLCLDRWDPASGHFAGGFLLVEFSGEHFSTLWQGLPEGATQERRWGCNYAERITRWRGLELREKIDPLAMLGLTWSATNHTDTAINLRVVAPWWLNVHHITPQPLMTYGTRQWIERCRARHASRHHVSLSSQRAVNEEPPCHGIVLEACLHRGGTHRYYPDRAKVDRDPGSFHLMVVNDDATRPFALLASEVKLDPVSRLPVWIEAAVDALKPVPDPIVVAFGKPRAGHAYFGEFRGASRIVLATERDAILNPGESVTSSACIGRLPGGRLRGNVDDWIEEQVWASERPMQVALDSLNNLALARELAWHSAYLSGAATYSGYHGARFVDQGSAYSYLQGLSGAPRDFALFILPMVYLDPYLAKDMLRYLFVSQHHRRGKLPYCTVGNGVQRGYVLHSFSSDLDLFLLWAAGEYLGATCDFSFLTEELPFYPKELKKSGTVLQHLEAAFAHLRDRVGLGPHGLVRCGSGDWNDVLLGYSRIPPLTFLRGESSLNAGLAALALPRLADVLEGHAPAFAAELRAFGVAQGEALRKMWSGRWAARGYLGYASKKLGEDRLFLDAQSFGVLANVWDAEQRAALFGAIEELCVAPQKVGALALWPPMKGPMLVPGSDTNGGTWAAIDALTAWAWAQHDPQRAWDFFLSTTLAAHAEAYPNVWYGVWSGPDSYNAHYHPRAGETFCHNFTPMTDFPIMNMNRHAGPLLNAIKFAGIEPRDGVIEICPRVPGDKFEFASPLISISGTPNEISGEYRPVCDGVFRFRVAVPPVLRGERFRATCNDESVTVEGGESTHEFRCAGSVSSPVRWRIGTA